MMRRTVLLLCCLLLACLVATGAVRAQPKPAAQPPATAQISADQARTALEMLNDPKKRAALAATLEAVVRAQSQAVAQAAPNGAAGQAAGTTAPAAAGKAQNGTPPANGTEPAAETQPADAAAADAKTHTTVEGISIPLAPDSLGAQVLVTASDFVNRAGLQAMDALRTVQSVPLLWGWAVVMVTNPWAHDLLIDVAWRLAIALAAALAAEWVLRRLLRRPIASLEALAPNGRGRHAHAELHDPADPDHETAALDAEDEALEHEALEPAPAAAVPAGAPAVSLADEQVARAEAGETEPQPPRVRRRPSPWTLLRRVPLVLGRLVLDLIPVVALALVGHLIAGSTLGGTTVTRLVILAVIDAVAFSSALLCVARMMLSPGTARLRLFHLPDARAHYAMRWVRRLVLIAVCGYAVSEGGLLLGLSDVAHDALQKAVGFALHVCLAIIVIQQRRRVRAWLRAPEGATGTMAALRNRLAAIWHWIALFFLAAVWLVYAVEVPHGFTAVVRYFGLTALVLILGRLTLLLVMGFVDRALRIGPTTAERYPGMEARLRLYHPAATSLTRAAIYVLIVLSLLQVYGLGTLSWLVTSLLGQRILSSLVTLLVTILLALAAWEGVNAAIQSHLARLQREAQLARSARLRTLLPLLRTTLLITILLVAGLMVLSEIGVNIAPLLAGAGIVGVAIGFGSQKLVQDLITGIFLLLENAMQVGDVVNVGGQGGVVESLSVRTIRLRSEDGSVHVIPFSSVTNVTNMTRDYSRAVINAGVAYKEDYDHVVEVLRALAKEMRADDAWKNIILDDLEVWGLDQFGDSAVVIKCRIMCTPFGRWSVMREFNRRMKKRFDELGIEIPFPYRKLVIDQPLTVSGSAIEESPHEQPRIAG